MWLRVVEVWTIIRADKSYFKGLSAKGIYFGAFRVVPSEEIWNQDNMFSVVWRVFGNCVRGKTVS